MSRKHEPIEKRFWKYTEKLTDSECWNWLGSKQTNGYGRITTTIEGTQYFIVASRLSWEIHYGKIPINALVCHTCDNPSCVNPNHLFLGTHSDNTKDMHQKKRHRIDVKWYEEYRKKFVYPRIRELNRKGYSIKRIIKDLHVSYEFVKKALRN